MQKQESKIFGILVKLGFLEESIVNFNEAFKLSPREAAYYNNKGFALTKFKDYEKADKNYEYAIHLAPEKKEYKLFRRINSIEKQNQSNQVQSEKLLKKIEHLLNDRRNILLKIDYEIK
jgi:tetratricopeptide (TPR) repeat protein